MNRESIQFGRPAREEWVPLEEVPDDEQRAEIRCPSRHLVGLVTNDQVFLGKRPHALGSSHSIPARCASCPRSTPDFDLDPAELRLRLATSKRRRPILRLDELVAAPT